MTQKLTAGQIRNLGFDWPRYEIIRQNWVLEDDGKVNLSKTIEEMQTSQAFYKKQLNQAFSFKMKYGADYSDFTDRHEEYAHMYHEFEKAISYLNKIMQAIEK
jgi:hypothetical protein